MTEKEIEELRDTVKNGKTLEERVRARRILKLKKINLTSGFEAQNKERELKNKKLREKARAQRKEILRLRKERFLKNKAEKSLKGARFGADKLSKIPFIGGGIAAYSALRSGDSQAAIDETIDLIDPTGLFRPEIMASGELPRNEQKKKEQFNKQRTSNMKVYNFLKGKDPSVINDYIEMLDKKGDRDGLRQALKAKKDSESRQKGKSFTAENYGQMAAMKRSRDLKSESNKDFQNAKASIENWKKERQPQSENDNEDFKGRNKLLNYYREMKGKIDEDQDEYEKQMDRLSPTRDYKEEEKKDQQAPKINRDLASMDEDAARIEKEFSDEAIQERFKKEDQSDELKGMIEKGLGKQTGTKMGQSKTEEKDVRDQPRGSNLDDEEADRALINQFIRQSRKRVGDR